LIRAQQARKQGVAQDIDHRDMTSTREAGATFLALLVVLTFAMNLVARGVPETFAVFLLPVQKGLGVSRSEITLTYSVYMLAYGLSGPLAGQLIDRFGARLSYGLGLTSLGIGYVLAGLSTELWQYMLTVGLLGGLGSASLGMIVASALLSRWFTTHIGSIISLPYAAIGAGMLTLPLLTQVLLHFYDWRTTHMILGVGVLLILPLVILLPLARMTAGSQEWRALRASARTGTNAPPVWNIASAVRTSAFWGLFTAYFFTSVAAYSVMPHSVAYLVERGFDPLLAASAFGIVGVGWLSDRFGRRQTATITYLSTIVGIIALSLVTVFPSLVLVYAFVIFFGLMQGARGPIIVAMVAQLFRGGVGAVYGTLSIAQGVGAGLGSWGSGLLYEVTGSYITSFMVAIGGAVIGMASFWVVRSLREERVASPIATAPTA
jgi:MFS family permease